MTKKQTSKAGERTHTPGPWEVDQFDGSNSRRLSDSGRMVPLQTSFRNIRAKGGKIIATVHRSGKGEKEANASLFAAAPDLLHALSEMLDLLEVWDIHFTDNRNPDGTEDQATLNLARAAIAKATRKR